MEESKNNLENRKIAIKMGGGGIGAVILLGGAVATAALASAFVVGRNGRNSGKDHHRRRHTSPPPPPIDEQKEEYEADKAQQFIVNKNPSGEIEEDESDNDTYFLVSNQSSTLDEKPEETNGEAPNRVDEINGGKQDNICDIQTSEQNLCSISLEKLETDVISDGSVAIEEKNCSLENNLQFEPQDMMHEDEVTTQLTDEDVYNEIPKEMQNVDQVHIEEESAESEPRDDDDGEINRTSHREAVEIIEKQPQQEDNHEEIKVILVYNAVEEVCFDQKEAEENVNMMKVEKELEEGQKCNNGEMVILKGHSGDGQKTLAPTLDCDVIEHENVNGDEGKGMSLSREVEIVKENNELTEGGEEDDQTNHVDERLVKEEEEYDQPDEIIVVEKREDPIEVINENVVEVTKHKENDIESEIKKEVLEEERITPDDQNVDITRDDAMDEEANESTEDENETSVKFIVGQQIHHEDDVARKMISEDEEKGENLTKDLDGEKAQLVDQEVEGKIREDKTAKKDEHGSKDSKITDQDISRCFDEKRDSERTNLINKYVAELAMSNDHLTNSITSRRIIIATLSVLSSLSCSWFFGLSFVKLCVVVFLTMVMSSVVTE